MLIMLQLQPLEDLDHTIKFKKRKNVFKFKLFLWLLAATSTLPFVFFLRFCFILFLIFCIPKQNKTYLLSFLLFRDKKTEKKELSIKFQWNPNKQNKKTRSMSMLADQNESADLHNANFFKNETHRFYFLGRFLKKVWKFENQQSIQLFLFVSNFDSKDLFEKEPKNFEQKNVICEICIFLFFFLKSKEWIEICILWYLQFHFFGLLFNLKNANSIKSKQKRKQKKCNLKETFFSFKIFFEFFSKSLII